MKVSTAISPIAQHVVTAAVNLTDIGLGVGKGKSRNFCSLEMYVDVNKGFPILRVQLTEERPNSSIVHMQVQSCLVTPPVAIS